MTIEQLRAKLKELAAKHKALTAKFDDLSEDERADLDKISSEFELTEKRLEAAERSEAMQASMSGSSGRLTGPSAVSTPRITGGEPASQQDGKHGFAHIGEFASVVMKSSAQGASIDKRLMPESAAATTYGSEGVGADGGFAVPPEFRKDIWREVFGTGSILAAAAPIPTNASSVAISTTEQTPWAANGIRAYWASEAGQATQTKPILRNTNIQIHKLLALVPLTNELLQDGPLVRSLITELAGEAIRWKADDAIINGDGVGKPLGVVNSGAIATQAKESGQSAATIVAANAVKMMGRMPAGSYADAVWVCSPDAFNQIPLMTIGSQMAWTAPNEGLKMAPVGFLLGRPIVVSHTCQTLGTAGDLYLANFKKGYAAYSNGGLQLDESIHLFFDYDEMAFRWRFRLGGQPYASAPYSPAKGSTTQSHFVNLAVRS